MKRWPKEIKVWPGDFGGRGWCKTWEGMLVAPDERVYTLVETPKKRKRRKARKRK